MDPKKTFIWAVSPDIPVDVAASIYESVKARYDADTRHYHDWEHVRTMLSTLVKVPRDETDDPRDLVVAIVFHDAVYDVGRKDNEEASAKLALERLVGLPERRRASIARLIRVTDHKREPKTQDEALICDIDLATLGSSPKSYDEYVQRVRAEYASVPVDAWRAKRAHVMEAFLARPRIFHSESFHRLELPARANIERELGNLKALLPSGCGCR